MACHSSIPTDSAADVAHVSPVLHQSPWSGLAGTWAAEHDRGHSKVQGVLSVCSECVCATVLLLIHNDLEKCVKCEKFLERSVCGQMSVITRHTCQ